MNIVWFLTLYWYKFLKDRGHSYYSLISPVITVPDIQGTFSRWAYSLTTGCFWHVHWWMRAGLWSWIVQVDWKPSTVGTLEDTLTSLHPSNQHMSMFSSLMYLNHNPQKTIWLHPAIWIIQSYRSLPPYICGFFF